MSREKSNTLESLLKDVPTSRRQALMRLLASTGALALLPTTQLVALEQRPPGRGKGKGNGDWPGDGRRRGKGKGDWPGDGRGRGKGNRPGDGRGKGDWPGEGGGRGKGKGGPPRGPARNPLFDATR